MKSTLRLPLISEQMKDDKVQAAIAGFLEFLASANVTPASFLSEKDEKATRPQEQLRGDAKTSNWISAGVNRTPLSSFQEILL